MDKQGNLLTVTVDINSRFVLSWGNPTEDQHQRAGSGDSSDGVDGRVSGRVAVDMTAGVIRFPDVHDDRHRVMMHGVDNAFPSKDGKILTLSFTGKNKTYVMMYASLMPILEKYRIVMMLTPQYFHQSRTGGRICVREDGLEINLLTLLGDHYGIPNPAWSTRNCWRENPALVISQTEKPVGGTKEYMKAYYLRTTATRREAREEAKRAKALAHVESRTRVDEIDDIIASLKGSGGGGPQTSESEIRKGRTLYGRDISHNDSRE